MVNTVEWVVQSGAGVRVEWGQAGARTLGPHSAALVVVDVLSFTTAVSVAVDAGTGVLPCPWRDGGAEEFAARHDAALAVGRRAISPERPWSLSPAALRGAPAPRRLVLPSPNGSAIAAAVSGVPVVAACLRNPSAVAAWLTQQGWGTADRPIAIIPAGEQWPGQDAVRPAIEDWVGAGMVVAALVEAGAAPLSAEALAAKALYDGITDVPGLVFECASGRQLADMGFGNDVAVATEMDTTTTVPVLTNGMFVDGAASPRVVHRAEQRQT
ncbi:2-phosphosulfolactate phosphatase [Nocardia fusca]|uniref:2-phosphosulfolactate phosphatase n=1 Tax=Nocardia fusca TaxID=941183 RepID=UPI0007A76745|nr:2-phosphosulfolactate phosphatase [Nocardia fusca]